MNELFTDFIVESSDNGEVVIHCLKQKDNGMYADILVVFLDLDTARILARDLINEVEYIESKMVEAGE